MASRRASAPARASRACDRPSSASRAARSATACAVSPSARWSAASRRFASAVSISATSARRRRLEGGGRVDKLVLLGTRRRKARLHVLTRRLGARRPLAPCSDVGRNDLSAPRLRFRFAQQGVQRRRASDASTRCSRHFAAQRGETMLQLRRRREGLERARGRGRFVDGFRFADRDAAQRPAQRRAPRGGLRCRTLGSHEPMARIVEATARFAGRLEGSAFALRRIADRCLRCLGLCS